LLIVKPNELKKRFSEKAATDKAKIALGFAMSGLSARNYNRIEGSSEMLRDLIMGVNLSGKALAGSFAKQPNCEVKHICDVDSRAAEKDGAYITGK